jgi:hypothetical protein
MLRCTAGTASESGIFGNYGLRSETWGSFPHRSSKSSGLGGGVGLHGVAGFGSDRGRDSFAAPRLKVTA